MADIGTYIKASDLPGDLLGRMEAVAINSGANFIAGKASSAFAREKEMFNNVMLMKNMSTDTELLKSISTDLIEHAVTVTSNRLTAYITEKTTELLDFQGMITTLTSSIAYWTKASLKTPAEILEEIKTKNVSDTNKELMDKMQEEGISDVKEKLSYTVGKISYFYDKNIGALSYGLGKITAYVTNGPSWVISTVNSYVGQVINTVEGFIGTQAYTAISFRDKTIDSLGKKIGTGLAQPINTIATNAAKKTKADAEKLISATQTKVINGISKAMMAVRQFTGIAIPIPFPKLPDLTTLF